LILTDCTMNGTFRQLRLRRNLPKRFHCVPLKTLTTLLQQRPLLLVLAV
jgi:hypothetical protein